MQKPTTDKFDRIVAGHGRIRLSHPLENSSDRDARRLGWAEIVQGFAVPDGLSGTARLTLGPEAERHRILLWRELMTAWPRRAATLLPARVSELYAQRLGCSALRAAVTNLMWRQRRFGHGLLVRRAVDCA